MDPFRNRYRLSKKGELLTCLALILAWGMTIQCCLQHDRVFQRDKRAREPEIASGNRFQVVENGLKRARGWMMTSSRGHTTSCVGPRGHSDDGSGGVNKFRMTKVVTHFQFSTLPLDGDVHPHPGPLTPTPTTTTPSASHQAPPPLITHAQPHSSESLLDLPPIHRPRASRQQEARGGETSTTTSTTTTSTTTSSHSSSGSNVNTDLSNQPVTEQTIGHRRGAEMTSDDPLGLFTNRADNDTEDITIPSQIPLYDSTISGSSVDDDPSASVIMGPWSSTQTNTQSGLSEYSGDDHMYGDEGEGRSVPVQSQSMGTSQDTFSDMQSDSAGEKINFSVGPNFSDYLNSSVPVPSASDSSVSEQNTNNDPMGEMSGGKEVSVSGLTRDELNVWSDTSVESVMLKCDVQVGQPVSECAREKGKKNTPNTLDAPTTSTRQPHRDTLPQSSESGSRSEGMLHTQSRDSQDKQDNGSKQDQMGDILRSLQSITTQMSKNQEQQINNQLQTQQALDANRQALEANKQATKKTQEVIDSMHTDIKKAHHDIRINQEQTQQAFQTAHRKLGKVNEEVSKTLEALTKVQKDMQETKTEIEANRKDIQDASSDIKKNKDDIQNLKEEIQDIKQKQKTYDRQQQQQETFNARCDNQRDRQEVLNRRANIVFYNIPEKTGRGRERTDEVVIDVLQEYMTDGDWKDSDCVTAYRAGRRYEGGKPRPIIATFDKPSDAAFILRHRQGREEMKRDSYGCGQDLTKSQKQRLQEIRDDGKQAYYTRGRLVVKDPNYDYRSRSRQENEERYRHRQSIQKDLQDRNTDKQDENRNMDSQAQLGTDDRPITIADDTADDALADTAQLGQGSQSGQLQDDVTTDTGSVHSNQAGQPEVNSQARYQSYQRRNLDRNNTDWGRQNTGNRGRTRFNDGNEGFSRFNFNDRDSFRKSLAARREKRTESRDRNGRSTARTQPDYQNLDKSNPKPFSHSSSVSHEANRPPFSGFSNQPEHTNPPSSNPFSASPPTFQQFQQMHNFFSSINRFLFQPHSTTPDHSTHSQSRCHRNHPQGDTSQKDTHTNPHTYGRSARSSHQQPPPPPPATTVGGGREGEGGSEGWVMAYPTKMGMVCGVTVSA